MDAQKRTKILGMLANLRDKISEYVTDTIVERLSEGGSLVDDDTFEKRKEICRSCPYFGKVTPLPFLKMDGCTLCGCPTKTKARFETIVRAEDKVGEELTYKDFITKSTRRKAVQKVECPHPNGNKWEF